MGDRRIGAVSTQLSFQERHKIDGWWRAGHPVTRSDFFEQQSKQYGHPISLG